MEALEVHPAATIFPMMGDDEFAEFVEDVRQNGIHHPILLFQGRIIDGRNRARAIEVCGEDPRAFTRSLEDNRSFDAESFDPFQYVLSLNLHRRHLTTSQRAMVASKLATLRNGEAGNGRKVGVSIDTPTIDDAAKQLNVGRATVARAKQLQETATTELISEVESGVKTINKALKELNQKPEKYQAVVEKIRKLLEDAEDKFVVARDLFDSMTHGQRVAVPMLWGDWLDDSVDQE